MKTLLFIITLVLTVPASADNLRIIDGDTIDLNGVRYRLEGIDAPEMAQRCKAVSGAWNCGIAARNALVEMTKGRNVTCRGDQRDKYGRVIGYCKAGGIDLNGQMVRRGYAWAFRKYSQTYVAQEHLAQTERRGIWQAKTMTAWQFRAKKWNAAEQVAPNGCVIKGNISENGRIYHMPWSKWYSRTRINPEKGERWFCNEAEAQSAGWRAVRG